MPDIIVPVATWSTPQSPAAADLCTSLSVKDAVQLLANRDEFMHALAPSLVAVEFTANTSGWVAPPEVQWALIFGCGGGGGGGGGRDGSTADINPLGGGGGGGARYGCVPVPLVPGTTYNITIGAGGAGGAVAGNGARGGVTHFRRGSDSAILAAFRGAGGGGGATTAAWIATQTIYHLGGGPHGDDADANIGWGANSRVILIDTATAPFDASSFSRPMQDSEGGAAVARAAGRPGRDCGVGNGSFVGGYGGALGLDAGTLRGGSGGGGGGAGPWGNGGDGGAGGTANALIIGNRNGGAGVAGGANTGAGGGGGGAGGGHAATVGTGGAGGAGGSGRMVLIYYAKGF